MKLIFAIILAFFFMSYADAQGVYIGTADNNPDASAILELESTSQGFLLPRMTTDEMNAISSPVAGLVIFNTDISDLSFYNGSEWQNFGGNSIGIEIGGQHLGGIVFYIDGTGEHGLIAASHDLVVEGVDQHMWGCIGTETFATSDTDGSTNTTTIIAACTDTDIAAYLCDNYSVTVGGTTYSDWFLPALDQLDSMYIHRYDIGGFQLKKYHSSTEFSNNNAMRIDFNNGGIRDDGKNKIMFVRPIMSF